MERRKTIELIKKRIAGQGNQVDLGSVLPEVLEGLAHPYLSLERLRAYLYRVTFDSLAEDNGGDNPAIGGCSAYVADGKLYRNLDFYYDEAASFIVRTKDFEGMSFATGLNDGEMDDALIAQLPYRMVDGVNNNGIKVTTHILFNDWDWKGNGKTPITRIPYLVLSKVRSMATIASDLGNVLNDLYAPESMGEYLIQFLITDGTTTYALLPSEDGYTLEDATSNPKMTNFRWVADAQVTRGSLQGRPTGVERFNLMPCPLGNLRFTLCYESNDRLSEFIGIDHTTKDSTDAELEEIYQKAHALYLERKRDGQTWQTMHSVVYGKDMEELFIQEDWTDNCVGENIANQIGELAGLDTDHKSTIVGAINELADLVETPHFVISLSTPSAEVKAIYNVCMENIVLAKNIVFYNSADNLYYCVNGYNKVGNVLKLHTLMQGIDVVLTIASNGTIIVE